MCIYVEQCLQQWGVLRQARTQIHLFRCPSSQTELHCSLHPIAAIQFTCHPLMLLHNMHRKRYAKFMLLNATSRSMSLGTVSCCH